MKIKKNGKVINLTESDLRRIVNKVLKEEYSDQYRLWHYNYPMKPDDFQDREFNPEEWEDEYYDNFEDFEQSDIYNEPKSNNIFTKGGRDSEWRDYNRSEFDRAKQIWPDNRLRVSRRRN
jgi:hypothetical protein